MKWFDLRSWAIGLLVGGLLVSVLWSFRERPNPETVNWETVGPPMKMGKYEPTNLEPETEVAAYGDPYSLLFRDDGIVEVEIALVNLNNELVLEPGGERARREAYAGKWKHSGELIEVEAKINYRYPRTTAFSFEVVSTSFKLHFRQSRSNPDNIHSPVQLILVRRNDKDLLRRDFVTWKWVGD